MASRRGQNEGSIYQRKDGRWVGAVTAVETIGGRRVVRLEDRRGVVRAFPLGPGFLIDGRPVCLLPPAPAVAAPKASLRSASGSVAVPSARARVAAASRIFVEGTHDAELVEKVWGHDLRVEGHQHRWRIADRRAVGDVAAHRASVANGW